jgi:hypothetical protein
MKVNACVLTLYYVSATFMVLSGITPMVHFAYSQKYTELFRLDTGSGGPPVEAIRLHDADALRIFSIICLVFISCVSLAFCVSHTSVHFRAGSGLPKIFVESMVIYLAVSIPQLIYYMVYFLSIRVQLKFPGWRETDCGLQKALVYNETFYTLYNGDAKEWIGISYGCTDEPSLPPGYLSKISLIEEKYTDGWFDVLGLVVPFIPIICFILAIRMSVDLRCTTEVRGLPGGNMDGWELTWFMELRDSEGNFYDFGFCDRRWTKRDTIHSATAVSLEPMYHSV